MSPARRRANEDTLSYGLRLTLYATCIVLPFVALLLGRLTGEQTVAAVVTLLGVVAPAVAITHAVKQEDAKQQAFETGYTLAVEDHDGVDYTGRHRAPEPGEGQR